MLAGSYTSNTFGNIEQELGRLNTQANLFKELEENLLKESGISDSDTVLEIGCGPGFITSLLCGLAHNGKVCATDTDEELLKLCANNVKNSPKNGLLLINTAQEKLLDYELSADFSYIRFVLQHLINPAQVISDVYECLKPGGLICMLDSDDGLIIQYPEDLFLKNLLQNSKIKQKEIGGDREIGRKLCNYARAAGFKEVKAKVLNFNTTTIPFSVFARVMLGFKAELCGSKDEVEKWIIKTTQKINSCEYFLSAGVVFVTAKK